MSTHITQIVIVWLISNLIFINVAFANICTDTKKQNLTVIFINGVFNKDKEDVRKVRGALTNILTKGTTNLQKARPNTNFSYIHQTTVIHWWKIHKIFIDFAPWDAQGRVYQVAADNYFDPDQTLVELRRLGLHPSQRPELYDIPPGTTLTDDVIKQALEDTLEKSYREVFSKEDIAQPGRVHSMHHLHHWIDLM